MEAYKITWEKDNVTTTLTILECNNVYHAKAKAKRLEKYYGKTVEIQKAER